MKRMMGWIPDLPDKRDQLYLKIKRLVPLPVVVDLRGFCSTVEDQGSLGSCTAQALVGNIEFLDVKDGGGHEDLSRLFVYYNERKIEGTIHVDSGAMLRDGIKTLNRDGVCEESLWPYKISDFAKRPSADCYKRARKNQIVSYHRVLSLQEMLNCLAEGFPFVFGFTVYDNLMSEEVTETGVLEMPGEDDKTQGGHAVMAVGYDMNKRTFLVRNSWGVGWGMDGYFTMPFEYLEVLADDFWTIRK